MDGDCKEEGRGTPVGEQLPKRLTTEFAREDKDAVIETWIFRILVSPRRCGCRCGCCLLNDENIGQPPQEKDNLLANEKPLENHIIDISALEFQGSHTPARGKAQ